jgi:hypothetical protein
MNTPKKDAFLTDYERIQPNIAKLVDFLEARLVKHRIANDSYEADPSLRGRIAELKVLIQNLKPADGTAIGSENPNLRKY